ncbi:unnamed protein product [Rhizoctonia solani]|uniref:Ricin B lectin domain-containing protein n=1 Tax=Rhizoctonia solani TaxID=456999 RepID=A0A8H3E0I8_9AGAM|nr:unnamed protein product [Rhizoctonia solani]CAE7134373.1 unnamed protein product [Rhizoctonia solani]
MKNLESGLYASVASVDGTCNGGKLHGSKDKCFWLLEQNTDGSVFITVPCTNYVADVDNGNPANGMTVRLWEKSGARQQRWYFEAL